MKKKFLKQILMDQNSEKSKIINFLKRTSGSIHLFNLDNIIINFGQNNDNYLKKSIIQSDDKKRKSKLFESTISSQKKTISKTITPNIESPLNNRFKRKKDSSAQNMKLNLMNSVEKDIKRNKQYYNDKNKKCDFTLTLKYTNSISNNNPQLCQTSRNTSKNNYLYSKFFNSTIDDTPNTLKKKDVLIKSNGFDPFKSINLTRISENTFEKNLGTETITNTLNKRFLNKTFFESNSKIYEEKKKSAVEQKISSLKRCKIKNFSKDKEKNSTLQREKKLIKNKKVINDDKGKNVKNKYKWEILSIDNNVFSGQNLNKNLTKKEIKNKEKNEKLKIDPPGIQLIKTQLNDNKVINLIWQRLNKNKSNQRVDKLNKIKESQLSDRIVHSIDSNRPSIIKRECISANKSFHDMIDSSKMDYHTYQLNTIKIQDDSNNELFNQESDRNSKQLKEHVMEFNYKFRSSSPKKFLNDKIKRVRFLSINDQIIDISNNDNIENPQKEKNEEIIKEENNTQNMENKLNQEDINISENTQEEEINKYIEIGNQSRNENFIYNFIKEENNNVEIHKEEIIPFLVLTNPASELQQKEITKIPECIIAKEEIIPFLVLTNTESEIQPKEITKIPQSNKSVEKESEEVKTSKEVGLSNDNELMKGEMKIVESSIEDIKEEIILKNEISQIREIKDTATIDQSPIIFKPEDPFTEPLILRHRCISVSEKSACSLFSTGSSDKQEEKAKEQREKLEKLNSKLNNLRNSQLLRQSLPAKVQPNLDMKSKIDGIQALFQKKNGETINKSVIKHSNTSHFVIHEENENIFINHNEEDVVDQMIINKPTRKYKVNKKSKKEF